MEKNHGFQIGERALRRKYNEPHQINFVMWQEFTFNETYIELAHEFPDDYRTIDGKKWVKNTVMCDICENQWRALYLEGTLQLQCPNCKQMAYPVLTENDK